MDSLDPSECDTQEDSLQHAQDIIQRQTSSVDSYDVFDSVPSPFILNRDFNVIAEPAVSTVKNFDSLDMLTVQDSHDCDSLADPVTFVR
eukprot:2377488-Pyramimonas_sp.AAC.1